MSHSTSVWPLTYYHAQLELQKASEDLLQTALTPAPDFWSVPSILHPLISLSPALPQACCTSNLNPGPDPVYRDGGADPPLFSPTCLSPGTLVFPSRPTQLLQSWRLTLPFRPGRQSRPGGAAGSWCWCPETPQVAHSVHCTAGAGAGAAIRLPEVLGTVRARRTGCATGPGKCASGHLVPEPSGQAQAGCGGDARGCGLPMRVVSGSPVLPRIARQRFKP